MQIPGVTPSPHQSDTLTLYLSSMSGSVFHTLVSFYSRACWRAKMVQSDCAIQIVYDIITLIKGRCAALLQVPGDAPGLPGGGPDVGGLHGVGQHGGVQGAQPAHAAPAQHLRDAVKTVKENSHLGITRQAFNLTAGQSAFVLSGLVLFCLVLSCLVLFCLVLSCLVLSCSG